MLELVHFLTLESELVDDLDLTACIFEGLAVPQSEV